MTPRELPDNLTDDALAEAERLLLAGDLRGCEQACVDVLAARPGSIEATSLFVDAKSLQFATDPAGSTAPLLKMVGSLRDEFARFYLTGLTFERWAAAQSSRGAPPYAANEWLREAMSAYEKAGKIAGDSDVRPLLRWNACLRMRRSDAPPRNRKA